MLPELRVIVERAQARRSMLYGLLDVIPADHWERRAADDAWTIANHVQHLATVEGLVLETVAAISAGAGEVWAGGAERLPDFVAERARLMMLVADLEADELRERMAESRHSLVAAVAGLEPHQLDATVRIAGLADSWGRPIGMSLRAYLGAWPDHDIDHDGAIRRALQAPPDLSAAAMVQRAQRRRN